MPGPQRVTVSCNISDSAPDIDSVKEQVCWSAERLLWNQSENRTLLYRCSYHEKMEWKKDRGTLIPDSGPDFRIRHTRIRRIRPSVGFAPGKKY